MFLLCVIAGLFLACTGVHGILSMDSMFPKARHCKAKYSDYYHEFPWICDQDRFAVPYPAGDIGALLQLDQYQEIAFYLKTTKNCHNYYSYPVKGGNQFYGYESICKAHRTPVTMVWAHVPKYTMTVDQQNFNHGLMPCIVLDGQDLYKIECVHPRAPAVTHDRDRYKGAKRHFCHLDYNFNSNYMCKPSGYVTREVAVYSPHANKVFYTKIDNVPTTCRCGTCICDKKKPVSHWKRRFRFFNFGRF